MRVRLVVPTSRSTAPDFAITSGMRNDPPISTSSPRETTTSPPSASEFSASNTAAALLLTTMVETSRSAVFSSFANKRSDMNIALAALAGLQIELEVGISLRNIGHVLQCGAAERRASEVGVQDDACSIDDGPQRVCERRLQP